MRFVTPLILVAGKLLETRDAALTLGLAPFRSGANPFEFAFERLPARRFGRFFLREPILLLIEPRAIVAFPWNAATAVELENPLGRVVQEVPVVRDRDDRSWKAREKLLDRKSVV